MCVTEQAIKDSACNNENDFMHLELFTDLFRFRRLLWELMFQNISNTLLGRVPLAVVQPSTNGVRGQP